MAKETKKKVAAKSGYEIAPWMLFIAASILLVGGWMMQSFPFLTFIALSPLFALVDKANSEAKFWNHAELILIALTLALLAGHLFQMSYLITCIIQAIALTLAFVGYGFVHQSLGPRAGKITIIIFWMAAEYVLLKLHWPGDSLFLADALALKKDWLNWTFYTGYLGASLWILITNWIFYLSIFKDGKPNIMWLIFFLFFTIAPIIFSLTTELHLITREEMIALYSNSVTPDNSIYLKRGEFIPRTAAWISVLIFIFALVKNKTQKK